MLAQDENPVSLRVFRAKRARYASRACKECQRRKVKCDGKIPCARCSGQSFTCVYATTSQRAPTTYKNGTKLCTVREGATMKQSLPTECKSPSRSTVSRPCSTNTASLPCSEATRRNTGLTLHQCPLELSPDAPEFCGPSSTEYTFNAVNGNLRAMGMQSVIPDKTLGSSIPPTPSGRLAQYGPFMKLLTMDPLWDMTREDVHSLIDDWCEGLGSIYPILCRRTMLKTADKIFDALSQARSGGLRETGGSVAEALFDHDTNKLKIVLAIGITKEAGGREHQAQRLFQSTSEAVEGLIWNPEGIHGIQLLFLVAMYHYHLNEEVRTGRCIAFAARFCLEAGLHRRAMLDKIFPDTSQCADALQAFWAVYMLERRLSLGQGIPFSIQDSYIDRSIYTIELTNPLLTSLLQWTMLAGKTWHALNNQIEKSYESRVNEINFLDYEIMEWYEGLPEQFRLADIAAWNLHQPTYYHSVFFVRKAHLRNLIYRPVLQLPVKAGHNEPILLKAIEISRETVRILFRLDEQTSLIRTHPMFFQQLLLTAFGNLLLAVVSTGPSIRRSTREEFDMFLQLFQILSSECTALRRTWHRLQGLRDLHTKLCHSERATQTPRPTNGIEDFGSRVTETLSFDDIFPDINFLSAIANTANVSDQPPVNTNQSSDPGYVSDSFVDLENLFDFPFLDFPNYV